MSLLAQSFSVYRGTVYCTVLYNGPVTKLTSNQAGRLCGADKLRAWPRTVRCQNLSLRQARFFTRYSAARIIVQPEPSRASCQHISYFRSGYILRRCHTPDATESYIELLVWGMHTVPSPRRPGADAGMAAQRRFSRRVPLFMSNTPASTTSTITPASPRSTKRRRWEN